MRPIVDIFKFKDTKYELLEEFQLFYLTCVGSILSNMTFYHGKWYLIMNLLFHDFDIDDFLCRSTFDYLPPKNSEVDLT